MAKAGYKITTSAAVALTAATARTVLAVLAPSGFGVDLRSVLVSFNGVTASDVSATVEICTLTAATNSTPGTNNTSESSNIIQIYGRSITAGFTGFSASTAGNEPTVQVEIKKGFITPLGSTYEYDWPQGETPDNDVSKGFCIRCTAPTSAVSVIAAMRFERT